MSACNRLQFSKQFLLCMFVIAVASQDTEKLILVQMENIVRQLEVLGHENSASEQRPMDKGENRASSVPTRCDSTVFDEPETANQRRSALPVAETDDVGSHQKKMNTSTSPTGVVSTQAAYSPSCDDPQKKTQAVKSHNTEPINETSYLRAELDSLRADLRRSDNTVSLLKRHIQLNTATDADGTPLPSLNPEVIVALAQEVERLNAELEKSQAISNSAEGIPNEQVKGRGSETEPSADHVSSTNAGRHQPVKQNVARCASPVLMQGLDTTLTGNAAAAAVNRRRRQKSASADDLTQLCDKPLGRLPTKDTLLVSCDEAAAGDGGQRSFLSSPVATEMRRLTAELGRTPFESTNVVNQRVFAALQAEVARLRRKLALVELENSRLLLEHSTRESLPTGRPSVNPYGDVSLPLDGSFVKYAASGYVTVAAGFLKKLVNVSVWVCKIS